MKIFVRLKTAFIIFLLLLLPLNSFNFVFPSVRASGYMQACPTQFNDTVGNTCYRYIYYPNIPLAPLGNDNTLNNMAIDSAGNLYTMDATNVIIIHTDQTVTTIPIPDQGQTLSVLSGQRLLIDHNDNVFFNQQLYYYDSGLGYNVYSQYVYELPAHASSIVSFISFADVDSYLLSVDANNNLYVADDDSFDLLMYPAGSSSGSSVFNNGNTIASAWADSVGNIYAITTPYTNSFYKIPSGGGGPVAINLLAGSTNAAMVFVDKFDNVWVFNQGSVTYPYYPLNDNDINKYQPGGVSPVKVVTGLSGVTRMWGDPQGNVYILHDHDYTTYNASNGYKFYAGSTAKHAFGGTFSSDVAADANGNIYFPDYTGSHYLIHVLKMFTQPTYDLAPNVDLSSSAKTATVGDNVTFTAAVVINDDHLNNPTGTVDFMDGATFMGSAALAYDSGLGCPFEQYSSSCEYATFSTNALTAGTHSITAHYEGDATYAPSDSQVLTQKINATALTCPSVSPAYTLNGNKCERYIRTAISLPASVNIMGMALDSSGNLYLTDTNHNNVLEYIGGTGSPVQISLSAGANYPYGIYVDSSDNIYTANNNSNDVTKIPAGGGAAQQITLSAGADSPVAITGDSSGNIFVANQRSNDVTEIPGGIGAPIKLTLPTPNPNGTLSNSYLTDIASDPSGNIYVANDDLGGYDKNSNYIISIPNGGSTGTGNDLFYNSYGVETIAADTLGNVYTGNDSNDITWLPAGGGAAKYIDVPGGLQTPYAVETDANNILYAGLADYNAAVMVLAPGDGGSGKLYSLTGLHWVQDIAVDSQRNIYATDGYTAIDKLTFDSINATGGSTISSNTNLQSSQNPADAGNNVQFTATITGAGGTATGTATFFDGATQLGSPVTLNGSGVATYSTTSLSVGSHNITADYSGDSTYDPSSSNTVIQVIKSTTATNLQSSLNPSNGGDNVMFTATVTGGATPTGNVTFYDGVTQMGSPVALNGSGVATYSTTSLSVGTHNITASYNGDSTHDTSNSNMVVQVVNSPSLTNTTTNLQSNLNPSNYGDSVTFTATVTGGTTPTGSVTFYDGVTQLGSAVTLNGSGVAQYVTSALSATSHNITANYSGDGTHNSSSSNTVIQVVNKLSSATNLQSSLNPSNYGDNITFTATVTGGPTPTGIVTFKDGTTTLGTGGLNPSGVVTLSTSTLNAGSHSITAVYSGDSIHNTSTSSAVNQVINMVNTSTTVQSSLNPSYSGNNVTFTATVTGVSPTGTVTFKDGVTTIGTGNLNGSGIATFSITSLSVGSHSITAVYGGDTNNNPSTSSNTITQTVNPLISTTSSLQSNLNPSYAGQNVTFTATVSGGATPTGSITFKDGSTTIGSGNLSGGVATFSTTSLAAGSHAMSAVYNGDSSHNTSTSNTVNQVVNSLTATSTTLQSSLNPSNEGEGVTFTATVTGGNPTGSVTFYDGSYIIGNANLNGSGVASLTISLYVVGYNSITATYNGDVSHSQSTSNIVYQVVNSTSGGGGGSGGGSGGSGGSGGTGTTITDVQSITLTSSESNGTAGDLITLTLVITNPTTSPVATGVVTYYDGTTVIGTSSLSSTGKSTLTTSNLSVGTHNIYAKYAGDSNYNSATSNTKEIIINNRIVPQTNPTSSPTQTVVPVNETSSSNENTQGNGNGGDFFGGVGDSINNVLLAIRNGSDKSTVQSLDASNSFTPYAPGTIVGGAALFGAGATILATEGGSAGLGILGIFIGTFIPRKKRYWGIVFDEENNKGIPFVTVNLKDSQGNLVGTTVSDLEGKFKLASQGGEILEVKVSGYQHKLERITGDMVEEGNIIAVVGLKKDNAGFSLNAIFHQLGSLIGIYISKITLILTVIGLIINVYEILISSNLYNALLVVFYGVVLALVLAKSILERFRSKGLVFDSQGRLVGGASVRIYDEKGVQLEVELSNSRGEVRFKIGEGKYLMKVNKEGYESDGKLIPVEILKGGNLSTNIKLNGNTGKPPHTSTPKPFVHKPVGLLDNPFTPKNFAIE